MANPIFGEGASLAVNDGANSAYVDFDDVTDITPPAETQVVVERNRLSVTTLVERAFSSRKDPGTFTFMYETGYTKFARIETLKGAASDPAWRIDSADDNIRLAFTGRVISNVPQQMTGGAITMATATVQLTSLVTVSDPTP